MSLYIGSAWILVGISNYEVYNRTMYQNIPIRRLVTKEEWPTRRCVTLVPCFLDFGGRFLTAVLSSFFSEFNKYHPIWWEIFGWQEGKYAADFIETKLDGVFAYSSAWVIACFLCLCSDMNCPEVRSDRSGLRELFLIIDANFFISMTLFHSLIEGELARK